MLFSLNHHQLFNLFELKLNFNDRTKFSINLIVKQNLLTYKFKFMKISDNTILKIASYHVDLHKFVFVLF